jgi:hypothetical protein
MLQDDLTADFPNGEVRFKALKLVEDRIEQYATNGLGSISLNYNGYAGGTTQFRDLKIFDGKQGVVAIFTGTNKNLLFGTATDKTTSTPHILAGDNISLSNTGSNALEIMANAYYDGAYKRLVAGGPASKIAVIGTSSNNVSILFQTDANTTADSAITWDTYYLFQKSSASLGKVGTPITILDGLNVGSATGAGTGDVKTSGDVLTDAFQNYFSSSTVVGWSSFTVSNIFYKKIGKMVLVLIHIAGTSNSTSTTFTLPYNIAVGSDIIASFQVTNNGASQTAPGMFYAPAGAAVVNCYIDFQGTSWAAGNGKIVLGQFFYEVA